VSVGGGRKQHIHTNTRKTVDRNPHTRQIRQFNKLILKSQDGGVFGVVVPPDRKGMYVLLRIEVLDRNQTIGPADIRPAGNNNKS
jgi:hypothetical protein